MCNIKEILGGKKDERYEAILRITAENERKLIKIGTKNSNILKNHAKLVKVVHN